MANKGYEIELFPSFRNINQEFKSFEENVKKTDKLNQYLEPLGKQIIGITDGLEIIKTRVHTWIVKYKSILSNEKVFEVEFGL